MYQDHRKGPGGPPGGATYPGGPHGLKWEGNQPLVGWGAPMGLPLRLGLETLGWGRPTCLVGQVSPLAAAPPSRWVLAGAPLPRGLYKKGAGRAVVL